MNPKSNRGSQDGDPKNKKGGNRRSEEGIHRVTTQNAPSNRGKTEESRNRISGRQ